jgi:hypothetical protein
MIDGEECRRLGVDGAGFWRRPRLSGCSWTDEGGGLMQGGSTPTGGKEQRWPTTRDGGWRWHEIGKQVSLAYEAMACTSLRLASRRR